MSSACGRSELPTATAKSSLFSQVIEVPGVPPREDVEIHLVPDRVRQVMEVRIWWQGRLVYTSIFPLAKMGVHF
jgi:hypothetical protein